MFGLRFDLRNPSFAGVTSTERVQAALDMAEWADTRGGVMVAVSEHHGQDDGYLPAPVVFASALAARTRTVRIMLAALPAPFYDPLRLAEDLAVLDAVAGGRLDVILAGGYVAEEFAMFGVPSSSRGERLEETVRLLRQAWTGEPFEFRGRRVRVTPTPSQPGGPRIVLGGSTAAAARRAARIADGFVPVDGSCWDAYREELGRVGKPDPGPRVETASATTFLSEDPESAWPILLPYLRHENAQYASLLDAAKLEGPYSTMTDEELRRSGPYRIITPEAHTEELRARGAMAFSYFQPMAGGIPPALAWESLHLFEERVVPRLES